MKLAISPRGADEGLTLGALLATLGADTVALLGSGPGSGPTTHSESLAHSIHGTEFYDAFEGLHEPPGTLLLATSSSRASAAELTALASQAAALGYAGIAVKCHESDGASYATISETTGIPFLLVSERTSWRLFDTLVTQLLSEHQHSGELYSADPHRDRGTEPLFALANELAEYFGGSVAIEDLGRRVIAYSSVPGQLIDALRTQGILTRRVPDSPSNDDQYRTVLRSEEPIKYPRVDGEIPRVTCAIRAGALPLGTIWAIDASGEGPLTEEQSRRIRAAAAIAASHMLDDIRVGKATQIPRENRLRTLLEGREVIGSELAELGISEERGAALLAFAQGPHDASAVPAQLRGTVQRHLAIHRPEAVTVVASGRVYALVADDAARPAAGLAAPLLPILDRLIGPGVSVAVPGVAHRSGEVAPLRQLADRLFDTATKHPQAASSRVLSTASMRPLLLFERAAEVFAASPELRSHELERLGAEDPLVAETLLAWCGAFGNIARTARTLCVHENTVRYRLRRAEDKYGILLDEADTLLTTWLQLRVTATPTPSSPLFSTTASPDRSTPA